MTSFHPTLSPAAFATYLWRARLTYDIKECLEPLFPEHRRELTDSGRSAFALVIEALDLRGKTILMPAYVCDAFYPVLLEYDIRSVFLDVDPKTYQPPQSVYTDELLHKADAVLLVATYGRLPEEEIISHLTKRGATIIEDHAMRSPLQPKPLRGAARIYSLPKTLPVPDGGLAILPRDVQVTLRPPHRFSLSFVKNVLKLLPGAARFIAFIRDLLRRGHGAASWDGIGSASALTRAVLADHCRKDPRVWTPEPFTYCLPIRTNDPARTAKRLMRRGVHAERIWSQPIVMNPDVQQHYHVDPTAFPETMRIAKSVVCAPLWHIRNKTEYHNYVAFLEKIPARDRSE